jgi:hypothetical protein
MKRKKIKNLIVVLAGIGLLLSGIIQCDSGNNNKTTLAAPVLVSPDSGATNQSAGLTFEWHKVNNASSYTLQLSTNSDFSSLLNNTSFTDTSATLTLSAGTTYYWRVNAINADGASAWSNEWFFSTYSGPLELVYPKGGSSRSFTVGDTVMILWSIHDKNQISSVGIRYSLDSGKTWAQNSIGGTSFSYPDTSYKWIIDSTKASNQFVLKVYDYMTTSIFDKSAPFIIKSAK